jgi:hypothetical protein
MERRTKRSDDSTEALQYLVESVADRSGVEALVLVDGQGQIVAGMGPAGALTGLARAAVDVGQRRAVPATLSIDSRRDVTARAIATPDGPLYLGALGDRMSRVGDAVRAIHRIVAGTPATA